MRASGGSGAVTAAVWAAGLAVMSLLLVDPNADDTHYVHQATWIAERGRFPVRDTLFSDERFQAMFFRRGTRSRRWRAPSRALPARAPRDSSISA